MKIEDNSTPKTKSIGQIKEKNLLNKNINGTNE